jgi:8-oxo-dGTP pyrophosphatase MutT (NUDIX family)
VLGPHSDLPTLPDDLPLVERDAVRLVVQDSEGHVLLFRAREITLPELGEWWELPGGGIDEGESYADAAARELEEETGLLVDAGRVGPPLWRRSCSYRFRGTRRLQHEVVVAARIEAEAPPLDVSGQLVHEREDYLSWRWAPVKAITTSRERFYPGRLPSLLPTFLAGEAISEPFELWS